MYLKKRAMALSIPLPCPSLQPPLQGSLLPLVNLQSARGGSGRRSLMVHSEWNGNRGAGPDCKNRKGQAKVQERRKPNQLAARGTAKQNKQTRQSYRWSWSHTEGGLQYLQDVCNPPCQHGGVCSEHGECRCSGTWTGSHCQQRKSKWDL